MMVEITQDEFGGLGANCIKPLSHFSDDLVRGLVRNCIWLNARIGFCLWLLPLNVHKSEKQLREFTG